VSIDARIEWDGVSSYEGKLMPKMRVYVNECQGSLLLNLSNA